MQLPTPRTPVARCEKIALYAQTLLSKYPDVAPLAEPLAAATGALVAAQAAYAASERDVVLARAALRHADHRADAGVRALARLAEMQDGVRKGRLHGQLFPKGTTPIVRPSGARQASVLRDLEARLGAASFPEAKPELTKLEALRVAYEEALTAREAAMHKTAELRAKRDAAREDFLDTYAEVAARVKAAYPRDRAMQNLFFDRIERARPQAGDDDDLDGGAPGDENDGAPLA